MVMSSPPGLLLLQKSFFRPMSSIFQSKEARIRVLRTIKARKGRLNPVDTQEEKKLPIFQYASEKPMSRVYTWGMACYGALGVPTYLRPKSEANGKRFTTMHRPARCWFAETRNVVDVACGYGFTVFAINNKKHHIMGTGINKDGQLGYVSVRKGHPLEMLIQPMGITLPVREPDKSKVVRVAAGRAHTLALTGDGDVFSLGNNAYGQCGRRVIEEEDYFKNQVVHRVRGGWEEKEEQVVDVYCGQDHSLFRTSSGHLYSCGWGADGQTGKGHYESTSEATEVVGDIKGQNVTKVATSSDCVLGLTENGEVFGWGNSEYGQLSEVTSEQQVCNPVKLPLRGLGKIIDIACGGTICLVLNENHDVFVWGYGILGKGPALEHSKTPVQIPNTLFGRNCFSPEVKVTSVQAGVNTCAVVNSNGELFMWGKNKGSCLGLGDYKDQYFPLKVSLANEVRKVSLGVDHTAALCKPWA